MGKRSAGGRLFWMVVCHFPNNILMFSGLVVAMSMILVATNGHCCCFNSFLPCTDLFKTMHLQSGWGWWGYVMMSEVLCYVFYCSSLNHFQTSYIFQVVGGSQTTLAYSSKDMTSVIWSTERKYWYFSTSHFETLHAFKNNFYKPLEVHHIRVLHFLFLIWQQKKKNEHDQDKEGNLKPHYLYHK